MFEPGNKLGSKFSSENQPEINGRPKGASRSTIARKVLAMSGLMPDSLFESLKQSFPEIEQKMSIEEMATIVQARNAIVDADVNAYKVLMDSAYGAPKQEIESIVTNLNILNIDPISDGTSNNSITEDSGTTQED